MPKFDRKNFGNNIRKIRRSKGLSQKNIADALEVTDATFARYESGEILPNAKTLNKLCDILDIYLSDLYFENTEKIANIENSKNPFKVNRLYLYYLGYRTKYKIDVFKLVIDLKEKNDYVEVKISNYETKKTILIGHVIADNFMATIRTENYKPNYPRLETNQIILNISGGTDGLIRGVMMCTNGEYVPNMKKCVVSKKDLSFNDDVLNYLKLDEDERKKLNKTDIWQGNISKQ